MGKTVTAVIGVVVAIGIAIAAPYLAPLALSALGIAATATAVAIATAVITVGLSLAASLAFRALGVGVPSARNAVGPPTVFRQAVGNSFIVYGKRRVGGQLIFFHALEDSNGDHWRYFVIAVAGHHCHALINFMLNDQIVTLSGATVTNGPYASNAWLWFEPGADPAPASTVFDSETGGKWTSAHLGSGIAKIFAKFKLTDDVVTAGMPNITAIIEGKDDILDPRTGTRGYTRNAALIFYDWMQIPREEGGFGAYPDEIPDNAWINAQANVCDETVNGKPRYALDAVIQTGADPSEIRDVLVVNQAGTYTYSGGKHLMRPGYWVPPSATLLEADLAGPIQVSPFMTADTVANEVQGTFISPESNYTAAALPTQSVAGSDVRQMDVDLAFVTNPDQGVRILQIMLKRAQCEKTAVWPMNIQGLALRAMDTVQVDKTDYSLDNYAWVITNWQFSPDFGAVLNLREENADVYDDGSAVTPVTPPTPSVPGPILTQAQIISLILGSKVVGMTFSIADTGAVTITTHSRWYDDKIVAVTGNVGSPHATGGTAGQLVYIFYDDPPRAGGAVTYQHLVLPSTGGDASSAFASTAHPYRHFVCSGAVPASGGSTTGGSDAGSGGGSDGFCETEDMPIWLANDTIDGPGEEVTLGDPRVVEGAWVWTQHQYRPVWGAFQIQYKQTAANQDVMKATINGRVRRATPDHVYDLGGWTRMADVSGAEPDGKATVVRLKVLDANTYYGGGLRSHNLKAGV